MIDISGYTALRRFEMFNRTTVFSKTFPALLIGQKGWYSKKCNLIWKLRATKCNRLYFQLQASVPRTEEIGCGLLPTAQTQGLKVCNQKGQTEFIDLGLLPTPTSVQRDHPERVAKLKATGAKTMMSRKNGENRPN